jgi:hypothetical protein
MPGLVPGIHVLVYLSGKDVDGRDKPGHDEKKGLVFKIFGENPRTLGCFFDQRSR